MLLDLEETSADCLRNAGCSFAYVYGFCVRLCTDFSHVVRLLCTYTAFILHIMCGFFVSIQLIFCACCTDFAYV